MSTELLEETSQSDGAVSSLFNLLKVADFENF